MVVFDNLARISQDLLKPSAVSDEAGALAHSKTLHSLELWKILGQEANGRLVVGWTAKSEHASAEYLTCIGVVHLKAKTLQMVCNINGRHNIIQATVNGLGTFVSYVIKEKHDNRDLYKHFMRRVDFSEGEIKAPQTELSGPQRCTQIMTNFLETTSNVLATLLVLIHLESINLYRLKNVEGAESLIVSKIDVISKSFVWAQWDCEIQALYFIHFRKRFVSIESENEDFPKVEKSPTLSCFQFHDNMPHETVLNVPLNFPADAKSAKPSKSIYEDDPLPLRIHDQSLDLIVVSNAKGIMCVCHHYLYEPMKVSTPSEDSAKGSTVHFAYSVTLLHHGCVINSAVSDIPWDSARTLRPVFALLGDQYLIVYAAGIFTHLLDVGLAHEPNCHILMKGTVSAVPEDASRLVVVNSDFAESDQREKEAAAFSPVIMLNLVTLDLIEFEISKEDLMASLVDNECSSNRLSILHYLLVHAHDFESLEEALSLLSKRPTDIDLPKFFQEVLIGGAYCLVRKKITAETKSLLNVLPITNCEPTRFSKRKMCDMTCAMTQEILWNTAMMLLSPQQRLRPFITDTWKILWDRLIKPNSEERFKPHEAVEKYSTSLSNNQAEIPSCFRGIPVTSNRKGSLSADENDSEPIFLGGRKKTGFELPFLEIDSCTISQQERTTTIISRELDLHLMKNCLQDTSTQAHSMAQLYVCAQTEVSKLLCHLLGKIAGIETAARKDKGFSLIKSLHAKQRVLLFAFYQRYYNAAVALGYPLPKGFSSFFCYLGFTTMPFHHFMMYLKNNVFELHIDVMKELLKDIEDNHEGVNKKLGLLLLLPRSRAERMLHCWPHGLSLIIRAREHALNVLSGVQSSQNYCQSLPSSRNRRGKASEASRGLAAFPSEDKLSPLDTFLDLLTAKASLAELDFNLIIEATISSTQDSFS